MFGVTLSIPHFEKCRTMPLLLFSYLLLSNPRSRRCDPRDYFTVEVLVVKLFTMLAIYIYIYIYIYVHVIYIYINDLSSILENSESSLFADDINLSTSDEILSNAQQKT